MIEEQIKSLFFLESNALPAHKACSVICGIILSQSQQLKRRLPKIYHFWPL